MPIEHLERLFAAVSAKYGCSLQHAGTIFIQDAELVEGARWSGAVEIYALTGHLQAGRCFAWVHGAGANSRCITVLRIPPVNSPRDAVRWAYSDSSHE